MNVLIRSIRQGDEEFLWKMLYYAAHVQEDGEVSEDAAKSNPDLKKYVQDWGRETDIGVIALHPQEKFPSGAAWVRLLERGKEAHIGIDDNIPELAIAVLPDYIGQGIGTQMLASLLEAASKVHPGVMLSVRKNNPARHLYERMGFEVVGTAINRVGSESYSMLIRFLPGVR